MDKIIHDDKFIVSTDEKIGTVQFIARYRRSDGSPQSVREHLEGTALLAKSFAAKVGLPTIGELMGLLHDLGKYPQAFQDYLNSAEGKLDPDDEDYVDATKLKGNIDHSTAGAQYLWGIMRNVAMQLMAICIASHHSGLIDCLSPDGNDVFRTRMEKSLEKTHLNEATERIDEQVSNRVEAILASPAIENELRCCLDTLLAGEQVPEIVAFYLGLLARFLFSALIDADRLDSAERHREVYPQWSLLQEQLEKHLADFKISNEVDEIRRDISTACPQFSQYDKGLYQLTVPTGGGKTLASLRFALHHAERLTMDRIIYVVPYTSIIDQNAGVARKIFKQTEETGQTVVLEHHSNLTPEKETDLGRMLAENWDAPIIFTTAVQFLETLFAARTRGARRMHQLANAVIIFDEVQTIPIKTIHLFNNAVNFLVKLCGSTVIFCTATQPLLDKVPVQKGAARLSDHPQMIQDVSELFQQLKRTNIIDKTKPVGWSDKEISDLVLQEINDQVAEDLTEKTEGSVLVVVNTEGGSKATLCALPEKR